MLQCQKYQIHRRNTRKVLEEEKNEKERRGQQRDTSGEMERKIRQGCLHVFLYFLDYVLRQSQFCLTIFYHHEC